MNEKPGVLLYWETFEVLESLLDGEAKIMLAAIKNYSRYGIVPDFSDNRVLATLWVIIQSKLDADSNKYKEICTKRAEAGKKSAELRSNKSQHLLTSVGKCQQIQPTTTQLQPNYNSTPTNIFMGTKKHNKFIPPTIEEIKSYCAERKNSVSAEKFFDFYSANGWTQGKGKPIKDWRACVRMWEHNNRTIAEQNKKAPKVYEEFTW